MEPLLLLPHLPCCGMNITTLTCIWGIPGEGAREVVEKEEEGKKKEWGAAANRSSFVAQARAAVAEAFPSLQIRTLRTFPIKYV